MNQPSLALVDRWLVEAKRAATTLDSAALDEAMSQLALELEKIRHGKALDKAAQQALKEQLSAFRALCVSQQQRLDRAVKQALGYLQTPTYTHIAKQKTADAGSLGSKAFIGRYV